MAYGDAYYGGFGSVPAQNFLEGTPGDLPDLNDEGLLTRLAKSTILPPIQFLASTLGKPGRAVRGLLDEQGPSALLNLLPFSDSLGITDPHGQPEGRDLLRKWGMADKEDTWGNWLGGLGVDILTDPLNLVGFGTGNALTKLGQVAAKEGTLAGTAAARIAAKQSGLMSLRTPFWLDMIPGVGDAMKGSVPLLTGDVGKSIATGMGRGVDYLMHEAPVISGPLSKLESMFSYGKSWLGDRRLNQAYAGSADIERGLSDAVIEPTTQLAMKAHQAITGMKALGIPEDMAKSIYNDAVLGAKEGGLSKELADQSIDRAIKWQLPPEIADRFKEALGGHAADAAEQLGNVYDTSRNYLRNTGKTVAALDDPWGNGYFHRQSVGGAMRKGSQQTERTIDPLALPGGTTQLNDLASDPGLAGIANKPIPAGTSVTQWETDLAKQLEERASAHAREVMAHRDAYLRNMGEGEFGMGPPKELIDKMSNENIQKASTRLIDFLANMNPDTVSKGWGYFHGDPISSALEYTSNLAKQAGPAAGNLVALAKAAQPAEETLRAAANPNEFVRLKDALNEIGQNAVDRSAGELTAGGKYSLLQRLADEGKTTSSFSKWANDVPKKSPLEELSNAIAAPKPASLSRAELEAMSNNQLYDAAEKFGGSGFIKTADKIEETSNWRDYVINRMTEKVTPPTELDTFKPVFASTQTAAPRASQPFSFNGINEDVADTVLNSKVVPRDLIDTIKKEAAGPGYSQKMGFGELADKITSGFRTGVTVGFPSYHARNLWEGILQQGLGGGLSGGTLKDTAAYLAGTIKDPALANEMTKYASEALATGAAFRNQTMHQLGESALSRDNQLINPLVEQGKSVSEGVTDALSRFKSQEGQTTYLTLNPKKNTYIQAGVKTHNDVDNLTRFSQYVELRRQGLEPTAARDVVMQSQMDYSKLTPAEAKLRQLIPFYSFSKQNIVRAGEQIKNPGPFNALLQAATQSGSEEYVPGYVSQGASVALPGQTEDGKKRYISGFSLPFEDELFGGLVSAASGHPWEGLRRGLTSANPLFKLAATAASGTQLYSGRSLDEVTSPLTALGLSNSTGNILSETLSATPAGRLVSTVNNSINGKDQNLLLKLLTGIKTTDVDQNMATSIAARDAVAKALQATGMVNTSQSYAPSKDYRDPENQPERLQYLLQLMRAMEQQARSAAQARAYSQ